MQRIYVTMLCVMTVTAAVAAAATAAEAATEGPSWVWNATILSGGTKHAITAKNIVPNVTKFKGPSGLNIECGEFTTAGQTSPSEIIGVNPGQLVSEIAFAKCTLEGKSLTECSVTGKGISTLGVIKIYVDGVFVYPLNKAKENPEALVAFVPVNTNNFTEITLEGTKCTPIPNRTTATLEASGTNITEPTFNKKCGLLAQFGEVSEMGVFSVIGAGVERETVGLKFPESAIAEGELSLSNGTYLKIGCELKVKSGFVNGKVTLNGIAAVTGGGVNKLSWENS